jgi:HK97 family phage prohead protease
LGLNISIPFAEEKSTSEIFDNYDIDGKAMFFAPIEKQLGSESGSRVSGMASTSDEDRSGDIVLPEAFRSSLAFFMENNALMFFNHDWNIPIGKIVRAEITEKGLFIEGELDDKADNETANQVSGFVDRNLLNAFSIGFRILDFDFREADESDEFGFPKGRIIKDIELLEVSLVTIPANKNAMTNTFKGYGAVPQDLMEKKLLEFRRAQQERDENSVAEDDSATDYSKVKVPALKSALYQILCDEDFHQADETGEAIRKGLYDDIKSALDAHDVPCPEYKKQTKMDIKEFMDGKRYEFQLLAVEDDEVMVWENTTDEVLKLSEMPRMIKNFIKESDAYDNPVHNVEDSAQDEATEKEAKSPETEKVEVPSEITDSKSEKLELAEVLSKIVTRIEDLDKEKKERNDRIQSAIEKAISDARNLGDL